MTSMDTSGDDTGASSRGTSLSTRNDASLSNLLVCVCCGDVKGIIVFVPACLKSSHFPMWLRTSNLVRV